MKPYLGFVFAWLASAALACTWGLSGCASDLDVQRESVDTGSFGTTVLTLVCKRMAYLDDLEDGDGRVDVRGDRYREICRQGLAAPPEATDQLKALQARRALLVDAVDGMWPETFLDELQAYATAGAFLSAYDDGTILAGVDALRDILRLAAPREEVTGVLERLARRRGYTPASAGAAHSLLAYPGLSEVLQHATGDIAPGGDAHGAMTLLSTAAALTLGNAGGWSEPEGTAALALDLLLREQPALTTGEPMLLVARDRRGLATVAPLAPGLLPHPYVDLDGDGLADVDDADRYLDRAGNPIAAPTPFPVAGVRDGSTLRDSRGRVIDRQTGLHVYHYLDLDRTLLAALLRDGAALLDPDPDIGPGTALDLVRGAGALLGPRQTARRTYENGAALVYEGFDTGRSALLDMLHGALQVLRDPGIYHTLALARAVLSDEEPALARLAEALVQAARIPDDFEGAALEPGSPLWDDLIPVVRRILDQPGLFEDLMAALEDPRVAALGAYFRDYMTYADQFTYDPETQAVVGRFVTEVDRAAPNSGFNRSVMQRVLHLLADTNGTPLCNKPDAVITFNGVAVKEYAEECELLRIDNLAVFYVQSMAYARDENGDFALDDEGRLLRKARFPFEWNDPLLEAAATDLVMELSSGIEGFRHHPTPQALNRTLFLEPRPEFLRNVVDPPRTRHGEIMEEVHRGTLPGWELGAFYDAIQPLVQPFADHDAEQLFVDLLVVMHDHWPARGSLDHQQDDPDAAGYAWASNVASYEPILAAILGRSDVLAALVDSMPAIRAVQAEGRPAAAILRDAADYLLAPREGLAKRNGDTGTTTADGRPVPVLSPWHLLADAYVLQQERFDQEGDRAEAWQRGFSRVIDVLARGEQDEEGRWRFRNPRLRGVGLALIDFAIERLRVHDAAGDRDTWLARDLPARAEDLLAGPLVAGASDVLDVMSRNPTGRRAIEGLLAHALDEARDPEAFRALATVLADTLQLVLRDERDMQPLAHLAADVLDPARGWLDPLLAVAHATGRADTRGALAQTLRNLVAPYRPGRTPLGDLADGIGEIYRARPFADLDRPFDHADYAAMLDDLAVFLDEEKRGLRKFIAIIQGRKR